MSYTVRSVEGNLKQKKVICGLDAKLYVVGGGGTTHVWGCLVFLNRMRSGCAEFATLRVVRVYVITDCANALHHFSIILFMLLFVRAFLYSYHALVNR